MIQQDITYMPMNHRLSKKVLVAFNLARGYSKVS